jgi:putative hydrolase of HD superfamily
VQNIKKFLSEVQMLKRLDHIGFKVAGITESDNLAGHALIAAQIAYILGQLEGCDAAKCAVINIFHDNHECRIGDHNKVSARYLDTDEAELNAEREQFANLPNDLNQKLFSLMNEKRDRSTKEGIVAQDADWLEIAIQGKIYLEKGYKGAQDFIDNVEKALETDSAKKILKEIKNDNDFTNTWWQGLKKMTYTKLEQ